MRRSKVIALLGILILVLATFFGWMLLQPPPERPNVSIKVLGYTNGSSGIRLAMIGVTNLGASTIFAYMPRILILAPAEPRGFTPSSEALVHWHSTLGRGASGIFTIPPPTNQLPWKLSFYVYSDLGVAHVIQRFLKGRRMPFEIQGDWINAEKP